MPVTDPQMVADQWAARLAQSQAKMTAGAQAVTISPTQKAAAAADKWQQRLADPATKAKFIAGLGRTQLADWQQAYITKGIPRVASGATAAKPKFTAFMQQFLPFVNAVAARVHAMPSMTLEDRINRAVAQMRGAAAFKRS